MARPELKQFEDLSAADFERNPVWVAVHTADYDEPWYEGTDEETFRPWTGPLPVDPTEGTFLVRTKVTLRDGTAIPGFVTPGPADPGIRQPRVFIDDGTIGFWLLPAFGGGMAGMPRAVRDHLYERLGKLPEIIFPARYEAEPGLAGEVSGEILGFYERRLWRLRTTY